MRGGARGGAKGVSSVRLLFRRPQLHLGAPRTRRTIAAAARWQHVDAPQHHKHARVARLVPEAE